MTKTNDVKQYLVKVNKTKMYNLIKEFFPQVKLPSMKNCYFYCVRRSLFFTLECGLNIFNLSVCAGRVCLSHYYDHDRIGVVWL